MTQQLINIGTTPGDNTGDQARMAFDKCNQNFTELYTTGAGTTTEGVWNFNQTSTDTTTSPTSGRFRTNSGNAATATQIAIHRISINGADRANTLRTQRVGDIIKLQDKTNADSWARFIVQATPVDNTDWFQINVAFDAGGGTAPGNNQEIIFQFAAASGGGGGGIPDAPSDGVRYVRQNAAWASGDAAYATPAQVALKADLASPTFTGDPKAPTPATADNDTSIATTAFVKAQAYLTGNQTVTLSGDVTGAGATAITATIANDAVTNAKLANMTAPAFKGRTTTGAGDPEDLTATQATAMLDLFTSALKGLAPPSGGGTTNFLRADATWATPPAGAVQPGTLVLIQRQDVSAAVATVDFTSGLDATYDEYEFHIFNVKPSAENNICLRVSFDGGATWRSDNIYSYNYRVQVASGTPVDGGGIAVLGYLAAAQGPTANVHPYSGIIRFWRPTDGTQYKSFMFDVTGYNTSTYGLFRAEGSCSYQGATTAINGVRFLLGAAGNITQGTFILYGRKK